MYFGSVKSQKYHGYMAWYESLSRIDGVKYEAPEWVDLSVVASLKSLRPQVLDLGQDFGEDRESLMWPMGGEGTTSQAPAGQWAVRLNDAKEMSTEELLACLHQAFSLPGEPQDYHFAMLTALKELWRRRKDDPTSFKALEELSWLDIHLIKTLPETVRDPYDKVYYQVPSFDYLVRLYEQQGALHEAIEVAEIAVKYDQLQDKLVKLQDKLGEEK